jgi:hypothetical protein
LTHPYFEDLHNVEDEPHADAPFDWEFDNFELEKGLMQTMVYEEALKFHPDSV